MLQKISYDLGAAILLAFFRASSNLLTVTSHFVDWQMCLDIAFTSSEKSVNPAARSTASTIKNISWTTLKVIDLTYPAQQNSLKERHLGSRH